MFARKVTARLKANSLAEFANLVQYEIIPWLRKQKGFQDLIILALPDGSEVTTISFWDQEDSAQAYNSTGYPEVLKTLGQLLDTVPYVRTFEVVSSTFRTAPGPLTHETGELIQQNDFARESENIRTLS